MRDTARVIPRRILNQKYFRVQPLLPWHISRGIYSKPTNYDNIIQKFPNRFTVAHSVKRL